MPTLEARVRGLERRVATVERLLAIEAAPAPAPVKRPAPPPPPSRPAPKPAPKPARSFEVDVGRWLLSRLGGLSLVVAAGFLFHYAAQQGWLGPQARLLLGSAAGLGLVAAGEWQSRRLRRFSAALTGTSWV